MKKKIITGTYILIVYFFSACAAKGPDLDPDLTSADSSKSAVITSDSLQSVNPVTEQVIGQALTTPSQQTIVNQSSSIATASGKNPPHGEPNHRCDIGVGEPLNSPVAKPVDQSVSKSASPVEQTTAAPVQKTTIQTETPAGMNPPHGEAGHRCDIEVGKPLNSPVKKPAEQTITPTPVNVKPQKDSGS